MFARGSSVFAVPFDLTQLAVTGEAVQLMDGVRVDGNDTHFAVANDGTLVYVPETATQSRLVWFDRKGQSQPSVRSRVVTRIRASPRTEPGWLLQLRANQAATKCGYMTSSEEPTRN